MFDAQNNAVFFRGTWHLNNPETMQAWANAAEALAWVDAQNALLNPPVPEVLAPLIVPVTNIQVAGPTVEQVGKFIGSRPDSW